MTTMDIPHGSSVNDPMHIIEQVMYSNGWTFDTPNEDELVAEIPGQWCYLRVWCHWDEESRVLTFHSAYDMKVATVSLREKLYPLLTMINERLWMGHFEIAGEEGAVLFRHAVPLRGSQGITEEQAEDVFLAAVEECDRFYPAFQAVIWAGREAREALDASLFETVGMA